MNEGYVAIIIGIIAFLYGLYCLFRMFAFRKWESTGGTVLECYKTTRRENFQTFEDAEITDIKCGYIRNGHSLFVKIYTNQDIWGCGEGVDATPGTYHYVCTLHENDMDGEVIVR